MTDTRIIENLSAVAATAHRDLESIKDRMLNFLNVHAQRGELFVKDDDRHYGGQKVARVPTYRGAGWVHNTGMGVNVHFYRADGKTVSLREKGVQATSLEIRT